MKNTTEEVHYKNILAYAVMATTQENRPKAPTAARQRRQPRVPPRAPRAPPIAAAPPPTPGGGGLGPYGRGGGTDLII